MKRREPINPDITPLVDVVFILLIFFIVSTVFKKDELALMLDLPSATESTTKVEQNQIFLELGINDIAFRGQKTDFESLKNDLALIQDKSQPTILRIDKDVPYERVVKVLDILQSMEFYNLALVTSD
ncbi:ExbD/TolR family protein [Arcobacter sp. FWKO B]|uniref:ExbD/TolR family protein n=1 Tax=Arcobacter sp. FWKO B TaxID=2593672 RepID=UPI0018A43B40|nr:biopolymer transporter ExbD [Arcobacter sp. FWKO B]QOG11962.1 biopolymer transporter ExbD [Arcobacter sp. FWKO B]